MLTLSMLATRKKSQSSKSHSHKALVIDILFSVENAEIEYLTEIELNRFIQTLVNFLVTELGDQEKFVGDISLNFIPGDGKPSFGSKMFIRTACLPLILVQSFL